MRISVCVYVVMSCGRGGDVQVPGFTGTLAPVANLKQLSYLNIRNNQLTGTLQHIGALRVVVVVMFFPNF